MEYTTLGRTGLKVSVAGLGCGGFSRLGLSAGGTEDEAARLVREAFYMGINFVDTAPIYGTEAIVGKELKDISRDSVIVATKALVSVRRLLDSFESLGFDGAHLDSRRGLQCGRTRTGRSTTAIT